MAVIMSCSVVCCDCMYYIQFGHQKHEYIYLKQLIIPGVLSYNINLHAIQKATIYLYHHIATANCITGFTSG